MLAFLIDTQLPPMLATRLKSKGCDAIHTTAFPNGHLLDDKTIRLIAVQQSRVIITKDSDFLDYYLLKGSPPRLLMLEFGNIRNKALLNLMDAHFESIVSLFDSGADAVALNRNTVSIY